MRAVTNLHEAVSGAESAEGPNPTDNALRHYNELWHYYMCTCNLKSDFTGRPEELLVIFISVTPRLLILTELWPRFDRDRWPNLVKICQNYW